MRGPRRSDGVLPGLGADIVFPACHAGVDEAGRGALFGPVCAAAVILDPDRPISGLRDSKKLSPGRRLELAPLIRERSLAWSVAWASAREVDQLNILRATMLAMRRAVLSLRLRPELTLIDGNRLPDLPCAALAIVGGDDLCSAISAASILAKTERDARITELASLYPGYGLESHKGYGTAAHLRALRELGPTPEHRMSYAPVRAFVRSGA